MVAKKTAVEQSEATEKKSAAKKTTAAKKSTEDKSTTAKKAAPRSPRRRRPRLEGHSQEDRREEDRREEDRGQEEHGEEEHGQERGRGRGRGADGSHDGGCEEDSWHGHGGQTAVPKPAARRTPATSRYAPARNPGPRKRSRRRARELQSEADRLRTEIDSSGRSLQGMMRDSGDGAGDDEADTGNKNITREHELALAATAREVLTQTERALERLDAGTYGLCENCGNPIGKARMQAFPRATLCVECKQKQERRY
ncbi:TraR/DksA family transcriptional regulator [Streptomyces thinghirensis]|nr:TraR/DksA family transcriptional regulator [Streptomyces thinghirensis]